MRIQDPVVATTFSDDLAQQFKPFLSSLPGVSLLVRD